MTASNSSNQHTDVNLRILRAQFNQLPPDKQVEFIKEALDLIFERTGMSIVEMRVEHQHRRMTDK
jgi:hypothetical protein